MNIKQHILLTGQPGVGKTTFIRKLVDRLTDLRPCGFYTVEIRESGLRKGFALEGLDGSRGILAHVDFRSPCRVSKYGVDVEGFDAFLRSLSLPGSACPVVIIDEIGKMECFSVLFRAIVKSILSSDKVLVATIAMKGGGIISDIKQRSDIVIVELNTANRDSLVPAVLEMIRESVKKDS